jgi:ribonuclease D
MNETKMPPSRDQIAEMEVFTGLEIDQIFVVRTAHHAALAVADLLSVGEVGFDTESKPTFQKGQVSEGPHVLQFSTTEKAYIFQAHVTESHPAIIELLNSDQVTKIGFGLGGDLHQISNRFGLRPQAIVDLDRSFKKIGYRNSIGAKSAVAMLFNRKLLKSKSVTTSNWAEPHLTDRQLIYAANDAYAALMVHRALADVS